MSGGISNIAKGTHSSVSAGQGNKAEGEFSSILGGEDNTLEAAGMWATIVGEAGIKFGTPKKVGG